jgi:hypothetical protein
MDYTLAGLRNRVLVDKLDDDEFDPQVVDNFLNDTLRDIYNQYELPFQEKIFVGTVPAGVTMFKLPDDVAIMQNQTVLGVQGFTKRQMKFRDFFRLHNDPDNAPSSQPLDWTLYAGNVLFSAPTDQDYQMTIFYIKKPKVLSVDADVPEFPEEFSETLLLGAYKRVLERNEDFDQANYINTQYNNELNLLVARYGYRESDGPIKMGNGQVATRRR